MVTTVVLANGTHQLHLECPALFPEVSVNTEPSFVVIKSRYLPQRALCQALNKTGNPTIFPSYGNKQILSPQPNCLTPPPPSSHSRHH